MILRSYRPQVKHIFFPTDSLIFSCLCMLDPTKQVIISFSKLWRSPSRCVSFLVLWRVSSSLFFSLSPLVLLIVCVQGVIVPTDSDKVPSLHGQRALYVNIRLPKQSIQMEISHFPDVRRRDVEKEKVFFFSFFGGFVCPLTACHSSVDLKRSRWAKNTHTHTLLLFLLPASLPPPSLPPSSFLPSSCSALLISLRRRHIRQAVWLLIHASFIEIE